MKTELRMCGAARLFAACLGKHTFILLQNGEVGGGAGCRTWLHLCIPQQLHSIQSQQTGSTHRQHNTDRISDAASLQDKNKLQVEKSEEQ